MQTDKRKRNRVRISRDEALGFLRRLESVIQLNPELPVEWTVSPDIYGSSEQICAIPLISIGKVGRDREGRMLTDSSPLEDDEIEWSDTIVVRAYKCQEDQE